MWWKCVGICVLMCNAMVYGEDSILTKSKGEWKCTGFCTVSWSGWTDGQLKEQRFLSFVANQNVNYHKKKSKTEHQLEIRTDLSYTKWIDSTWIKNTDAGYLNYQCKKSEGMYLRSSFTINLRSQFTDTWTYRTSGNKQVRSWKNGPMTPGTLIIAYGKTADISPTSSITLGLVGAEIKTYNIHMQKNDTAEVQWGKVGMQSLLGWNVGLSINEKLCTFVSLDNRSQFFLSKFKKTGMNADVQTRIWIDLYKNIRIKLENKLIFNPKDKIPFRQRNEVMIGLFLK